MPHSGHSKISLLIPSTRHKATFAITEIIAHTTSIMRSHVSISAYPAHTTINPIVERRVKESTILTEEIRKKRGRKTPFKMLYFCKDPVSVSDDLYDIIRVSPSDPAPVL